MRKLPASFVMAAALMFIQSEAAWSQSDFVRGDLNGDQVVDSTDYNLLQAFVFMAAGALQCYEAADINNNGTITSTDVIWLFSYVFSSGQPPSPPFPNCGPDPLPPTFSCITGCNSGGDCDSICQTAPSFLPSGDTTLPAGHHVFCDFRLTPGVDVTTLGACTLDVAGLFLIDSGASLRSHCEPLIINYLDDSVALRIYGEVTDTCASPQDSGGTFILRSRGGMILGGDSAGSPASITAADLFIGDPEYAPDDDDPAPFVYVHTGESLMTNLPPLANIRGTFTPPATIDIEIVALSLTSLPSIGILHLGNGDSVVNPPLMVQYTYPEAGTYRVVYHLEDNLGNATRTSLVINIPTGEMLQGHVMPFASESLVMGVAEPRFYSGQASATCYLSNWSFEGDIVAGTLVEHTWYEPSISIATFSGTVGPSEYEITVPAYVKLGGQQGSVSYPPRPNVIFPGCDPPFIEAARGPDTHITECAPCTFCDVPPEELGFPPGSTFLVLGDVSLRTTRIGGWLVTGFADATIIILPGFAMAGAPGAAGGIGQSGKMGGGFAQVTIDGQIIDCGGFYMVGDGGDGGDDGDVGCPASSRAGRGGDAGVVAYLAPQGSVSWCGDIIFIGGSGGNGGSATATGTPAGACANGCAATSRGGNGGLGGGGFAVLASEICYDSGYSMTFGGTCIGGDGGTALSLASSGGDCGICSFKAGDGGFAGAYGGKGGSSFYFFAMFPFPEPEELVGHLIPIGAWDGGDGDDATAVSGDGGNALVDCCDPPRPGIDGGAGARAEAHGGTHGPGMTTDGAPGDGNATCGSGGNGKDGEPPGNGGAGSIAHDDIVPGLPSAEAACPPGIPGDCCPNPGIPWNPRWNFPPGFRFGQNDTTISGVLYQASTPVGAYPIQLFGQTSYETISGHAGQIPVYSVEEGRMRFSPGAASFDLTALPGGATADGFYAEVLDHSGQAASVHLLGYMGGVLVSHEVGNAACAETLLQIDVAPARTPGAALNQLDSVVLWGLDMTFIGDFGLGASVTAPDCPILLTGDVNLSGTITSSDIIGLVNYVFKGGATPLPCAASGDVNCSGTVTSADIITMVSYVFKAGPPPCNACTSPLAAGC